MCYDPSLYYLNNLGYNVIRYPGTDMKPLLLLSIASRYERRKVSILGSIDHVLKDSNDADFDKFKTDNLTENQDAPKIQQAISKKFNIKIGLGILKNILSFFGGGLNFEGSFSQTKKVEIVFDNVKHDYVYPADIAEFMVKYEPNLESLLLEQFDEENEAFIVTDIIKSNKFTIKSFTQNDASAKIDIPAIKDAVDVSAGLEISSNLENEITFEGKTHLAFGFKMGVFWIDVENKKFKLGKTSSRMYKEFGYHNADFINPDTLTQVILSRNELIETVVFDDSGL